MHFMNTPERIFADSYAYMFIICAGMICTVAYNMFASFLRAFGNSVVPLYFLIFSSLMNIILDLVFIESMKMGVAGAALATVISELISAALAGVYFFRYYKPMLPGRSDFRITKELLGELSSNGAAMAFMYSVVNLGSVFFQGANNKLAETLGDGIITAHTAARRLIGITMTPLGTITSAAATYIGQYYGAKERDRIRKGLQDEIFIVVGWGVFACLMIYLFGEQLVRFTTGTSDTYIIKNAVLSLRIHLPLYPVLGILLALRTAMQAVNIKTPTVVSSSIELGMKIIAAVWLIPEIGFIGTCVTEPVTWVICTVFLIIIYRGKKKDLYGGEAYDRTRKTGRWAGIRFLG
jgi:Na+-driven multidrug efflux pump